VLQQDTCLGEFEIRKVSGKVLVSGLELCQVFALSRQVTLDIGLPGLEFRDLDVERALNKEPEGGSQRA
jgi:ABC-type long-subunit fatty acid transport system fused permease/ATPase subunit